MSDRKDFQEGRYRLMIRKILVATDDSDHARKAVEYASDIALKYNAMVYLIHVSSPPPFFDYSEAILGPLKDRIEKAGEEILKRAERRVREKGVERVQTFLANGNPADEILQYAEENNVDMILLGSRGTSQIGMLILGSVAHKVCNLAECTCVTVK